MKKIKLTEESKEIIEDCIKRGILKDTPEGYVVISSEPIPLSSTGTLEWDKTFIIPEGGTLDLSNYYDPKYQHDKYIGTRKFFKSLKMSEELDLQE